jgi:hypothetical protein
MTTAYIADGSGNPILVRDEQQGPDSWFATGAGHVNPKESLRS